MWQQALIKQDHLIVFPFDGSYPHSDIPIFRRPSILADETKRQGPSMDFYQLAGYVTGLLVVRPELEAQSLWPTAALVHSIDAILCGVIANHSRRNVIGWSLGGLVCGIWALTILFLLPVRNTAKN
jgi:hypothetical protein